MTGVLCAFGSAACHSAEPGNANAASSLPATASPNDAATEDLFEIEVRPLFIARCQACHGPTKSLANLRLTSRQDLLEGGDSGAALVPGDSAASLLVAAIEQHDELKMPPNGKLTDQEIRAVRQWIDQGAPWPDGAGLSGPDNGLSGSAPHWSFRPLAQVPIPRIAKNAHRLRTPVDAFVLAKLQARGLTFSPDADPVTLLRRVAMDITGLPPSLEMLDETSRDPRPDAYEQLVDRLLSTPAFGERWGRHWLDVSGYVDTLGYDVNIAQFIRTDNKWLYRDYVVRMFNFDRPFHDFIREQLAGDEIANWRDATKYTPAQLDPLIATGYLRNAEDRTDEDISPVLKRYEVLYDTLQIFGSNFLGLSLQCARCHDHKYEPVTQEDYYRLMAVFTPAFNPGQWKNPQTRPLADIPAAEKAAIDEHNKHLDDQVKQINERMETLKQSYNDQVLKVRLEALPEPIRADTQQALITPQDKRDEVQKYLANQFAPLSKIAIEDVTPFLTDEDKVVKDELTQGLTGLESQRRRYGMIQAVYDVGAPPETYILHRGDHESPERAVQPGFMGALSDSDISPWMPSTPVRSATSGRRTAVARWLTDPQSPASALTVRILVNRLWHQLTGRGIVPSRDNFGVTGMPPTHPELLEWLSHEFVAGGWRIKPLLRTILLSSTYRQATYRESANGVTAAAELDADPIAVDPGNELLWKMRLRRLESECIRDTMLAASDTLNLELGGPPILTVVLPDGMTVISDKDLRSPAAGWRRSLYLLNRRQCNLSFLSVFDQPNMNVNCTARQASAVPLQSLAMMNGDIVWEQAEHLARRIVREAGNDPNEQIALAYRLTLSRRPAIDELEQFRRFLADQQPLLTAGGVASDLVAFRALVNLCQTLLNSNEFIYVE